MPCDGFPIRSPRAYSSSSRLPRIWEPSERRQRPRVVGVEGDLDVAAHRVAPFVAGFVCRAFWTISTRPTCMTRQLNLNAPGYPS